MAKGRIWHPAPRGLIVDAAVGNWTRDNPAPDLVVYLWIWAQRDDGENPTRRRVAQRFGWTEHYARQMVDRVRKEHREWVEEFSPAAFRSRRPAESSNDANLRALISRKSPRNTQVSPDHARAITTHPQNTTPINDLIEEIGKWQRD